MFMVHEKATLELVSTRVGITSHCIQLVARKPSLARYRGSRPSAA